MQKYKHIKSNFSFVSISAANYKTNNMTENPTTITINYDKPHIGKNIDRLMETSGVNDYKNSTQDQTKNDTEAMIQSDQNTPGKCSIT